MKQFVLEEQINKLTTGQEDKLIDYLYHIDMYFDFEEPKSVTIGKMIEILNVSPKGRIALAKVFNTLTGWEGKAFKENSKDGEWLDGIDLCDTLWDIILKAIIN